MKKINYILLCLLVVFGVLGCKKDKGAFEEKLLIDIDYMEVSSRTNTYNFEVLSNTAIAVETDADWIVLDTTAYEKGKQRIGFSTVSNEDDERSGTISVRINQDESRQVLVIQESGKVPVFYVTVDGTGDGKSWNTPTDLTTAIEKATTNSTIYLAEGIYRPSKTIRNGDANEESDKTFEISKNISLIGGFPADALPGARPNADLYKTVLEGKLTSGKEVFHTVTVTAALDQDSKVHLEGLTIQGGNATDRATNTTISSVKYSRGNGGGLLIANAIVYLKKVEIVGNKATNDKGTAGFAAGMYVFAGARVTMEDSKVNENTNNNNNGGGVWVADATLTAYGCEFNDNYARGTAGGIHGYPNANIYLYDSEVMNNNNTSYGAGVYVRENSNAVIVNCLIVGNKSTSANGGGGVMQYGGTKVDIISSTITGNEVVGPGAGIYRRDKVNNLTVINSIISGNKQASTSKDIDAHTDNATIIPSVKNTVNAASTYDDAGTVVAGAIFTPSSMLSAAYLPVGTNNPALTYGLTGASLVTIGQSYTPVLDKRIEKDINGESRGSTVMGAKIK
ncbi:MAG: hypothetical protein LBE37_12265 [Sphingobacterium sp.]|nr:hypothetical protein [Sphingobacterium sp.]